ncbi:unnamed protein product [Calicophoron daubneyi]|uniref:Adenine phosphoribosyltransferase n=1 Tax=Calicophoron daubneyi TaxID=300641 RepID=A0AAV2T1F2_CALDB
MHGTIFQTSDSTGVQNGGNNDRIAQIDAAVGIVPDFPKPGIQFRDIFGIFKDPVVTQNLIDELMLLISKNVLSTNSPSSISKKIDAVLGLDARGFLLGPVLALNLKCAFVPIRKVGKLPGNCFSTSYDLEYGSATVEIQADGLRQGDQVIIFDDVLATGGTVRAATDLVRKCGANPMAAIFIIELNELEGRKKIESADVSVHSLIKY